MLPNLSALCHESVPTGVEPKGAKGKAKKQKKNKNLERDIQDTWDEVHKLDDADKMLSPLLRLLGYGQKERTSRLQEEVHQFLLRQYANAQKQPGCKRSYYLRPNGKCVEAYEILIKDLRKRWSPELFQGGPWDEKKKA